MANWKTFSSIIGQGDAKKVMVNLDLVTHIVRNQAEGCMLVFVGDTHLPITERFEDIIKEHE
jgi:hypothetical protein